MKIALLIARLFLALILGVAGAIKAGDLGRTRTAVIGFGVPVRLAVPLGSCLPFVEIFLALALLPTRTAWLAAIAALGLLLLFAGAIAANLTRGQKPDCNCFGQLHSRPVSWSVFSRNIMLAGVAVLVVADGHEDPGLSAFNWLSGLKAAEIASLALSIAAVGLLAAAVICLRQIIGIQSAVLARVEAMKKVIDEDYAEPSVEREDAAGPLAGLPVGAPAPSFSLASISGEQVTLEDLLAHGKPVLLLFVSSNCSPCKSVLQAVTRWERAHRKHLTIALLMKEGRRRNQGQMAGYGASLVLLQGDSGVDAEYDVRWTPAGVLIGLGGRIVVRTTYGYEAIQELVSRAISPSYAKARGTAAAIGATGTNGKGHVPETIVGTPRSFPGLGEPAPSFSLPDLAGEVVTSKDLLGRDTLLLFWNPNCPFCREMSDDIARWEANPPRRVTRLIFVSSGDVEVVRAESTRFKSRILHDPELGTGVLFATNATPSAVLIDARGRIASTVEAGRANILALAGARRRLAPASSEV